MSDNNNQTPAPVAANTPAVSPETESDVIEGEGSEESETPAQESKAVKEEKKRLKKLMLKVDGEEIEEELPFEIDEAQAEYMKRHLQLSRMSQKRAQYASQIEKEAHQLIDLLRTNPRAVLSDPAIGIDVKKLAAEIIEQEVENSRKSPEQLEKEKLEAELKAIKEEQKRKAEEAAEREKQLLTEKAFQDYDNALTSALEKNPDLPKSPYVVKKMAENMLLALKNGIDLSPEDIVPMVREEIQNDIKQMFAVMPEDVIESLVGKDKIKAIRKKYVAQAKANPIVNNLADTAKKDKKDESPKEKKTIKQLLGI